jgi:4-amino-4-deoxy-L-arabinose transferase-like glycosyltransferase
MRRYLLKIQKESSKTKMKRNSDRDRIILFGFAVLLITFVIRGPAVIHPFPIDNEGNYSVVAHEILAGGKPYVNAVERKPPLLFWIYEFIFFAFGKYNWVALHLSSGFWIFLTMLGLYAIVARFFGYEAGFAAALLYCVYTTASDYKNLAFNGEVMMNLPIVWAFFVAFRRTESRTRLELILSGFLLCCAFLIKQPAAIAAIPVGIYLLLPSYRRSRELSVRDSLFQAGLLTAAYFLTLTAAALLLYRQGILREAFYWSIRDHDIPHGPTDPIFWQRLLSNTRDFAAEMSLPLMLGFLSVRRTRSGGHRYWMSFEPEFQAIIVLLACSAVGVCASGRFHPHYYFQLVPALVILAAPVLSAIWTGRYRYRFFFLKSRFLTTFLVATTAAFLVINAVGLFGVRSGSVLSRYIREHSGPEDKVFFWGQADFMYAQAERRPASRYILCFPLTGYIFGSPTGDDPSYDTSYRILPGAWEILEKELSFSKPLFIVDTDIGTIAKKYPPKRYPVLRRLLETEYRVVFSDSEGVIYRRVASDNRS